MATALRYDRAILAVAILAALGLAACGDDSGAGGDAGARSDGAAARDGGVSTDGGPMRDAGGPADATIADGGGGADSGALLPGELPGDELAPFEGGPSYWSRFSHGPPAEPSFFPITVWLQSPSNAGRYAAIGINTFIGLYGGPTDAQLSDSRSGLHDGVL